jgi:hypothetical protein
MHIVGEAYNFPFAISVRDLVERVKKLLVQDHPEGLEAAGIAIPSESYVAYQFSPKHASHATSLAYTGVYQNCKY